MLNRKAPLGLYLGHCPGNLLAAGGGVHTVFPGAAIGALLSLKPGEELAEALGRKLSSKTGFGCMEEGAQGRVRQQKIFHLLSACLPYVRHFTYPSDTSQSLR